MPNIKEKQNKNKSSEVIERPRMYYNAGGMLRYNPLWALILGERSTGKSFEFKRRSIVTDNSIWVYLRRTDILRRDPKNWKSYLSDLLQKEVIDIDAEYKVNSEGLWVDGIQKVIFSALSTDSGAHSMNYLPDSMGKTKKNSKVGGYKARKVDEKEEDEFKAIRTGHTLHEKERLINAIDNVKSEYDKPVDIKKKIVFEEIIEPTGRYIKNEVEQLFEFYVTVDRYTDTQLFGIANLMTTYNPYFEYFGIRPFTEEFRWFKNKALLVQNVKLAGMDNFVKSQRFYNLVEGTDYGAYLTNNTPWQDDNYGICKKPPKAKLRYNIKMHNETFGVWEHEGLLYISKKYNPEYLTFSGLKSLTDEDVPIRKNEGVHKLLNSSASLGLIRFETIAMREIVYEIINGGFKDA